MQINIKINLHKIKQEISTKLGTLFCNLTELMIKTQYSITDFYQVINPYTFMHIQWKVLGWLVVSNIKTLPIVAKVKKNKDAISGY